MSNFRDRLKAVGERLKTEAKPAEPKPVEATPVQPTKQEKRKEAKEAKKTFVFSCGHKGEIPVCGACKNERQKIRNQKRREKKAAKACEDLVKPKLEHPDWRLPHGSEKKLKYNAVEVMWYGEMVVPDIGTFHATANTESRCFHALDAEYRKAIGQAKDGA
jgi:hypothetical protein